MSFVSYAQNFEDVMLWRALGHIEGGLYVDVGAQHPVVDSVSKGFYLHGWRGIHIEPVLKYAELLRADRPDETVLQVALSDSEGTVSLNVIADTGLSTAIDSYAERHHEERGFEHQRVEVPVLTLKSALASLAGKQVHWLKIDVEGFETKVLKGWDSQQLRPWVIVVEATIPNSTELDYASWDPILTAANYHFVYFDGLNRFYIAAEHEELAPAFSRPPNVFDNFELSGMATWALCRSVAAAGQHALEQATQVADQLRAENELAQQGLAELAQGKAALQEDLAALQDALAAMDERARAQAAQTEALGVELAGAGSSLAQQEAQTHHWWTVADGLNRELTVIRASAVWRATAACTRMAGAAKLAPRTALHQAMRAVRFCVRFAVRRALRVVMASAPLKRLGFSLMEALPSVKSRLRGIAVRDGLVAATGTPAAAPGIAPPATTPSRRALAVGPIPQGLSHNGARKYIQLAKAVHSRKI